MPLHSRYRALFSYYGGKSRIAHLYPAPKFPLIVEPFAGAAGYSLRYPQSKVWLNELNPRVHSVWHWFIYEDEQVVRGWIERLPERIERGAEVANIVPGCPTPLLTLLQFEAGQGAGGSEGDNRTIFSPFGAISSKRLRSRLLYWLPILRHWAVSNLSYHKLPDLEATWFVDPPYNNPAGERYRYHDLDYSALADWCRSRRGQVIVCENAGATWLPFEPLCERRGIKSATVKSRAMEVIYTQG